MENNIQRGLKEAVGGAITAFIVQIFIVIFEKISFIPSTYVMLLVLIQIAGIITDILLILSWQNVGIGFFVGWWLGMILMAYSGLVEVWLMALYVVVAVATIALKLWSNARSSQDYDFYGYH